MAPIFLKKKMRKRHQPVTEIVVGVLIFLFRNELYLSNGV